MIVRNVPEQVLATLAADTGVVLHNVQRVSKTRVRFGLRPIAAGRGKMAKWQRLSASAFHAERKVHAVCYHGHYAFMAALFDRVPDAVLVTAMARYSGRDDFHRKAPEVGERNIGSPMYPRAHADACACGI